MKDSHVERSSPGKIPVLSPIAHFVAMSALVFLRSSFGIDFLRHKSVFLGFSWFFILLTVFVAYHPSLWREYHVACIFGLSAIALYWLHLATSALRNVQDKAEHDLYSGNSHLLLLLRRSNGSNERRQHIVHIWIEPAILVIAAAILRVFYAERHLALWLIFAAACLCFSELTNFWSEDVRRPKIQKDIEADAEKQGQRSAHGGSEIEPPRATRKLGAKLKRNTRSAEEAAKQDRFETLLRLRKPYTLEEAEDHYRDLAKLEHPKTNENSPESNAAMAEINEAIAFIRSRLGG